MTLTITLDSKTEEAILRKAARLGLTPNDYLARLAEKSVLPRNRAKHHDRAKQTKEKSPTLTPAQAVARWREQRLVSGYGDPAIDAPELARALRADAENRQWE